VSGWNISYEVRPADPSDRRSHPEAHEVRMMNGEKPLRVVGVWDMRHQADQVAEMLNRWARQQVR
jgi:hypothetical protein